VAVTDRDVQLFAARIRLHFPPEQRDIAYELAYGIARIVGPKVKLLTPDTTMDEIVAWIQAEEPFGSLDSLDKVEWIMALEEELPGLDIPDDLASNTDRTTLRDVVERRAKHRR
jgi:acyl carrier protein